VVCRIFQVGVRVFSDGQEGGFVDGMTYPDFIYFMLSEEDKTTDASLNYWFRCCDLDGDGFLSPEEMRYFYRNQIHRITNLGQESINFQDILCQMMDMVAPAVPTAITIEDLIRPDKRMISGMSCFMDLFAVQLIDW
jgi:serine/threonine-protein phosphatase 2A regulatory subunit B''